MNVIKGWHFDTNLGMYRIPICIRNPKTGGKIIKFCLFDTGFSGFLGLDRESIISLKLESIGKGKGVTAKGVINYDNFEAFLEIDDENGAILAVIENTDSEDKKSPITIQEFDIPILGIKAIKQFSWLILSEKNSIFLMK